MTDKEYKCLLVEEQNGTFKRSVTHQKISNLPEGDVLIRVKYSALNYKDALSAAGNRGVTKKYPHTPGIDAAGIVEESSSLLFNVNEEVIVTGYDLGMNTPGGFAEYIRVPAEWVVKKPAGFTLKESMALGTAGFTAALALLKIQLNGINGRDVLVTGATGGVGSLAVAVFAKSGFNVTASTGKKDAAEYLAKLGAAKVISREEVTDTSGKPMLKGKWDAVVDTAGGQILESAIASTKMFGSVASCGLVQSHKISTTVYPFILRGINLLGINSAETNINTRKNIWQRLSSDWKPDMLNDITTEHTLEELNKDIDLILEGKIRGRIVVKL